MSGPARLYRSFSELPKPAFEPTMEQRQTSMLQWLRRKGHWVDFSLNPDFGPFPIGGEAVRKPPPAPPKSASYEGYSTPKMLKAADGKPCPYCSKTMMRGSARPPSRDHVKPRHVGGTLAPGNCIIVCAPCNNDKGGKTLQQFVEWLIRRRDGRAAIMLALIERMNIAAA